MEEKYEVKLAVTGGSGFIARGVLEACAELGLPCRALSRSSRPPWAGAAIQWTVIPSYDDAEALAQSTAGTQHILHLADNSSRGGSHGKDEAVRNCVALIDAARRNKVSGIIVASSVYAREGLHTGAESYGAVKRAIEDQLRAAPDLRTIILRLPPVYGPGGKGGMMTLSKLVRKQIPLPLGAAVASRAYLSRRNLASLIVAIANAPDERWTAAAQTFFEPSDGAAISTRDLIGQMASSMGVSARLLPVPVWALRALAAVTGKTDLVAGAVAGLEVAPVEELERHFGWRPIERMPQSLAFLGG